MVSLVLLVAALLTLGTDVQGCEQVLKCFDNKVNDLLNKQIALELSGHYTYLYLSQLFQRHSTFFPRVAKFFRECANEEFEHADHIIDFQNDRRGSVEMNPVAVYQAGACADVKTITEAFKCALELETHVTSQVTQLYQEVSNIEVDLGSECNNEENITSDDLRLAQPMAVTCALTPGGKDVTTALWRTCQCDSIKSVAYTGLADMIQSTFLSHQIEDMKEMANLYRTVFRMQTNPEFGDYMFDKNFEL